MKKTTIRAALSILLVFFIIHPGAGLNSESIIRLKEAGLSDETIQVIVAQKIIETAAFTVEEIVNMKKAGLSDETIRMVINESSFLKHSQPIVYGKAIRSIQFTTVQDIIELKKAGISDDVIQAIITVVGESNETERNEALDLLEKMNIRIDLRGN
ncbi:MAG: hypothetical protein PVF56_25540 [Desulfobacterales bacterium]|jgi:uncharacterized protein (DUF433 family)